MITNPYKRRMDAYRITLDAAHLRPEELFSPLEPEVFTVDARHLHDAGNTDLNVSITREIAQLLMRTTNDATSPGFALVTNLDVSDNARNRVQHEALFKRVWSVFQIEAVLAPGVCEVSLTRDGSIDCSLYGDQWTYKRPHMDRNALVFSHLYGPIDGFDGGETIIIDARRYLQQNRLSFVEAFEWSNEPQGGSKPVLRDSHMRRALDECGVNLGRLDQRQILFVNNTPASGILHGAAPLRIMCRSRFIREIHRCAIPGNLQWNNSTDATTEL